MWTSPTYLNGAPWAKPLLSTVVVTALALFTAFMETLTISGVRSPCLPCAPVCLGGTTDVTRVCFPSVPMVVGPHVSASAVLGSLLCVSQFPYYTHKNKEYMYTVGSACYAIYFVVSFPMYYRCVFVARRCVSDPARTLPLYLHTYLCRSYCTQVFASLTARKPLPLMTARKPSPL